MFNRKNKNQPTRLPQPSSQPASVFSYYASRSSTETNTGRGREPERTGSAGWWHHVPSLLAAAAIIGSMGYLLTLNTTPKFIPLNTATNSLFQPTGTYETIGRNIFSESVYSHTKLTIDTDKLARELKDKLPELKSISVIIPLFSRRPVVQIQAAQPALVLVNQQGAYVIDTEGRVVLKKSEAPSSALQDLPTVNDELGLEIHKGESALPEHTVSFISQVIAQLRAKDISAKDFTLPAAANELHMRLDNQPYVVKFNVQANARQQVGTFLAVRARLEGDRVTPKEYIDVRVDERAYYK
jgi:hypothetical protein